MKSTRKFAINHTAATMLRQTQQPCGCLTSQRSVTKSKSGQKLVKLGSFCRVLGNLETICFRDAINRHLITTIHRAFLRIANAYISFGSRPHTRLASLRGTKQSRKEAPTLDCFVVPPCNDAKRRSVKRLKRRHKNNGDTPK